MGCLKRVLIVVAVGMLVLTVAIGGWLYWVTRHPWPGIDGTVDVTGLQGPAEILRDQWGVPHIYAVNSHDLFFAQGYAHAQDRFYQMEFWRRIGQGRLSEMLGETALENDRFIRTLGWWRAALAFSTKRSLSKTPCGWAARTC